MRREAVLLTILMVLGGLYNLSLGQNTHWDLLNYHLYNGFALLNGRLGVDVFPAAMHTTFNPLLDAFYYFIFSHLFNFPRIMAFVLGLPYGVLIWVVYHLSREIFQKAPIRYRNILIWCATLLGVTASGNLSQIGGATGEVYLTILKIISLWLAVLFIRQHQKTHLIYISALIMGMVVGFKLTAASTSLALLGLFLWQWKRMKNPWKSLFLFACAGILGFLIIDGYFLWFRYREYHNPLFPLLNQVFKSPYFEPTFLTDRRVGPQNMMQWVLFPFYWAFRFVGGYAAENPFRDPRLAICVVLIPFLYTEEIAKLRQKLLPTHLFNSLMIFAGVGYLIWLLEFSILRYAGELEILSGIIIVVFLGSVGKTWWKICLSLLAVQGLILWTICPEWGHIPFRYHAFKPLEIQEERVTDEEYRFMQNHPTQQFREKKLFPLPPQQIELPHIEDNSLVFTMIVGSSFMLPLLNPKASFMGGYYHEPNDYPLIYRGAARRQNYSFPEDFFAHHLEDLQRKKIMEHDGPIYILSRDWPMVVHAPVLAKFGLKGRWEDCTPIKMPMYHWTFALCKVTKM